MRNTNKKRKVHDALLFTISRSRYCTRPHISHFCNEVAGPKHSFILYRKDTLE